jgi:aminoglycoside phosphotransferase
MGRNDQQEGRDTAHTTSFLQRLRSKWDLFSIRWQFKHGKQLQPGVVKSGNIVIKCGRTISLTEAKAMKFVAENTDVPVPQVIATYDTSKGVKYLVTKYIEGATLESLLKTITRDELRTICEQLRGYMNQVRSLKPPRPSVVGAVDYSPCMDPRLFSDPFGPFYSLDDFYHFIRRIEDENHPHLKIQELVRAHKSERYRNFRVLFTHCDLAPRNILVKEGKIAGIVDWELAGWYPEYWEYTRAWETAWYVRSWKSVLPEFLDVYEEELKIERIRILMWENALDLEDGEDATTEVRDAPVNSKAALSNSK